MLPLYVISLKKDIERREAIKNKLDSLKISFEFVDAIYGKDLSVNIINSLNVEGLALKRGFTPSQSEIGCALSHLKVYHLILDRKQPWVCILEDDAILDNRMCDFLNHFSANQSKFDNKNLYLLGRGESPISLVATSFFSYFYVGKQKIMKTIRSEKYICGAFCYLMSQDLAEKIIALSKSVFLLADNWEYMITNDIIKNIYLSDFIKHPKDMSLSNLEADRVAGKKMVIKNGFIERMMGALTYRIEFYLRLLKVQLYRFKK